LLIMKTLLVTAVTFLTLPCVVLSQQGNTSNISTSPQPQDTQIRQLIEQLVLTEEPAPPNEFMPPIHPNMASDKSADYRQRYERCQTAFKKLTAFKGAAFPIMLEHLGDKRQSIPFRNHYTEHSVGIACYWNIYFQLTDQPENYSSYGYQRKGRDGELHVKPYWEGSPFDEARGIPQWLIQNKNLSYVEIQIKCLNWLLEREKKIGAPDAESYFENILPLEIRILERRLEKGDDVAKELERLRIILNSKDANAVPKELLPADTTAHPS